jgi:hypothetical protein
MDEPGGVGKGTMLRAGGAILLAVVVGVAAWLVLRDEDDDRPVSARPKAVTVTAENLRALAESRDQPIFWAGSQRGTTLELTRAAGGTVYLRYLPRGVRAGDPRPAFLTVATYALANGYQRVRAAAARPGANVRRLTGGGLMVVNPRRPSSVYLGYPGGRYQVEVYDPSPKRARDLVQSGRVSPVG